MVNRIVIVAQGDGRWQARVDYDNGERDELFNRSLHDCLHFVRVQAQRLRGRTTQEMKL